MTSIAKGCATLTRAAADQRYGFEQMRIVEDTERHGADDKAWRIRWDLILRELVQADIAAQKTQG